MVWQGPGERGIPTSLWETGGLSQIQGILWWRGWNVGRRQKSREEIWSEGCGLAEELPKGGCQLGGLLTATEGTLSLPSQEPQWTEKRLAQAASAPWGLLTRQEREVRGATGLRAGGFSRVSGPEQLCELQKGLCLSGPQFPRPRRQGWDKGRTANSCQELCLQKVMSWGMSVPGAGCATPSPCHPHTPCIEDNAARRAGAGDAWRARPQENARQQWLCLSLVPPRRLQDAKPGEGSPPAEHRDPAWVSVVTSDMALPSPSPEMVRGSPPQRARAPVHTAVVIIRQRALGRPPPAQIRC